MWASRYQKGKTSLDLNESGDDWGFGMAVASAGPYANNLHLAPQTDNYTNTPSLNFYRPDALFNARPTNSVKALKANKVNCKVN